MLKIAHRGASGYEPENTRASFKKALEFDVDGIELDVHVSKDGSVVVMHDPWLLRTIKTFGFVSSKTLKELKQLDAGKGEKIPTLEEVLDLVNKKTQINIELKGKNTALPVSKIINEYVKKKGWKYSDFFVSSFNHQELKEFRKLLPQIKLGALIVGIFVRIDHYIKEFNPYSLNISAQFVRKSIVDKAHKKGLKVIVYTVNEKKAIQTMKSFGVDGIISDFPDRVV